MGTNYNPCAVTDGLKLYLDAQNVNSYPGTGTTWYDISGNSNHATFVNSPVYYANPTANMTFNGTNAYMTIARSSSMSPTAGISQEIWFKYDSSLTNIHFTGVQYGNSYGNSYGIWSETTNLFSGVNISGTFNYLSSSVSFVLNTWYHCVHTYDGSIQKLYLNGNLLNSLATSGSIAYDSNNTLVTIGSDFQGAGYNSGVSWFLNGKLAQVRIYDRALSSDEINQNYNSTKKRYSPEENIVTDGLVFNSDSGRPSSYPGTGTAIYDLSGSGNTAILTNGPTYSSLNGGTIVFDGSNDYLEAAHSSSLNISGSITVDVWIYLTSLSNSNDMCLIAKYSNAGGATNQSWILFKSTTNYASLSPNGTGGNNEFVWLATSGGNGNGTFVGTGEQVQANTWYNVTALYNSSNEKIEIYINGQLKSSTTRTGQTSGVLQTNTRNLSIGSTPADGTRYVQGRIPVARVYSRALTSTEILQNYNAIKNRYGLS